MTRSLPAGLVVALSVLLSSVFIAPAAAQDPNDHCTVGEAVILATNSARLANDVAVHSGDVVVDDFSPGPTLGNGHELYVDKKTTVAGSLKADSIIIFSQATIAGNVFYSQGLTNQGTIQGTALGTLGLPVFDPLPPFIPTSPPRGLVADVFVAAGQTVTLAAGDYGDVVVAAGGTIVFSGGIYNLASVDLAADDGRLLFQAASEVRIDSKLRTRRRAVIGPAAGSGLSASQIVFYVAGINGLNGGLNSTPEAARIGSDSTVTGNFYAPNGTLRLELRTVATGAFLGRDVMVDSRAGVSLASAFANRAPTAQPRSVSTGGAGSVSITLRGSDPEGQDLAFAIAVAPTAGTLSGLTPIVPAPLPDTNNPGSFVQPPITSATVTYTPNSPGAEAPDAFTFSITDGCGKVGMAIVGINPFDPSPPDPGLTAVEASEMSIETVADVPVAIDLAAGGPSGDTLAFAVESLPQHGTLADSGGTAIGGVPHGLLDRRVTYTPAAGFTGFDSFSFRASGSPSGTSDTAIVSLDVSERPLLADDVEAETPLNQPVLITLRGNPGGTGTIGSPVQALPKLHKLVARATAGASIAGNVSDATGDGLGDGRDELPGSAPVLVAAGVDVNLGATPVGSVTDPAGDAIDDSRDDPANPDLVSATVARSGTNLDLTVRFVAAGFSSATSRGSFVLDTDENPATGFPGVDAANNDSALMGVEFLVNVGADLGANAQVFKFISLPNNFSLVGTFAATVRSNGYSVSVPLSALDGDDGRLSFKAEAQSYLGPGFTGILDYMPDLGLAPGVARTGIQGVARIHAEWDIRGVGATDPDQVESAIVTLSTQKGTVDDLVTFFFAGTQDQDGVLAVSDFEAPAAAIPGVTMPVPAVPTGTEGSFSFNVTQQVKQAVGRGDAFFSIQGRVDEGLAGGGFRRGLQVRSSATGNPAAGKEPRLEVATVEPSVSNLSFTILTLPTRGALTFAGFPVAAGQTFVNTAFLPVLYTPALNLSGADGFSYRVTEGVLSRDALVAITVLVNDGCAEVGRPPGCAPAGN